MKSFFLIFTSVMCFTAAHACVEMTSETTYTVDGSGHVEL